MAVRFPSTPTLLVEEVVTERTRTEVWQGLWDVHRMVRYYQAVHGRYQLYNRISMCALVIFGTSAFATLWERVPDVVQPIVGLLVAGVSLWVLFADYAAKSAIAHAIANQCEGIAIEWSTLFARLDSPEDDVDERLAREQLDGLKMRMKDATYRSGDANLPDNERINEQATAAATADLTASYA